eukprot:1086294-Pelagomonas_calceolata.AAC.1
MGKVVRLKVGWSAACQESQTEVDCETQREGVYAMSDGCEVPVGMGFSPCVIWPLPAAAFEAACFKSSSKSPASLWPLPVAAWGATRARSSIKSPAASWPLP